MYRLHCRTQRFYQQSSTWKSIFNKQSIWFGSLLYAIRYIFGLRDSKSILEITDDCRQFPHVKPMFSFQSPTPPEYIFWYHNDRMINYDTVRGGITVTVEPGPKTYSRLIVTRATQADSGNYSCRAPNTLPDAIHVFVTKGEYGVTALPHILTNCVCVYSSVRKLSV